MAGCRIRGCDCDQPLPDDVHALDLAAGREALVETLAPELGHQLGEVLEARLERLQQVRPGQQRRVDLGGDVAAEADQRLEARVARDHVVLVVAPGIAEAAARRLEHVADQAVAALLAPAATVLEAVRRVAPLDQLEHLAEQLRLVDPHLLRRTAAEHVDVVLQRRVVGLVERAHQLRRVLLLRVGAPLDALVQVDEVRLVDARVRRVDDDEHLGGEVTGLAVEDHHRHLDALVGVLFLQVEVQAREAVLAVDDQEVAARFDQVAGAFHAGERLEVELLGGEQEDCARDHRLPRLVAVEVFDLLHLPAVQRALEGLAVLLDRLHVALDFVEFLLAAEVAADGLAAIAIEARDEADLAEQILGRVADEVELRLLLAHAQGEHLGLLAVATRREVCAEEAFGAKVGRPGRAGGGASERRRRRAPAGGIGSW
jgi:hypothetical protein